MEQTHQITTRTRVAITFLDNGQVDVHGVSVHKPLLMARTPQFCVIKTTGHSENPGSRYSGLISYYPGEMTTYLIGEHIDGSTYWCHPLVAVSTARTKK